MNNLSIEEKLKNNIFFQDKLLNLTQYELKNIKIIEEMFNNKNRINVLITPDKEVIEVLSLIVLAIRLYIENLSYKDKNILEFLNIGDIVVYEGKKAEYLGVFKIYGEKKIKFKYKGNTINGVKMDDAINYIRVSDQYKLSLYTGDSKELNIMSNKRSNKRSGKYVLADMLDINLKELGNIIKEQMIIVYPSKNKLEELLEKIQINIKDKKYFFTEVFPSKYYSSIDNSIDLKGNKLKLKEIFIFTSNLSVARDVIQENKEISNLLLLGEDTYINQIDSSLDFLLKRKKIKKIYILNTFDKIKQIDSLLESNFDIKLNAWTRSAFLKEYNEVNLFDKYFGNRKIEIFLNRKLENKLIDQCVNNVDSIVENLFKLRSNLIQLWKEDFDFDDKDIFLINSYGLLNIFEKTIIPIKEYDDFIKNNNLNNYTVNMLIEKNEKILEKNKTYEYNYRALYVIIKLIKTISRLMYNKNPKLSFLKNINLNCGDLIICNNSIEEIVLKNYEFIDNRNVKVSSIKNYRNYECDNNFFYNIIFTSIYNNKTLDQIHCYDSFNVINLLYSSEVYRYNVKVNKFNSLFNLIEEKNSLGSSKYKEELQNINIYYNKFIRDYNVDYEKIEKDKKELEKSLYYTEKIGIYKQCLEYEYDFDIDDLLNIDLKSNLHEQLLEDVSTHDIAIVRKKISFKDKRYALLTEFCKSKCISSQNNNIVEKNIHMLQIGDRLIFINNRTEDEITKLFCIIMRSVKFKNKYEKDYKNMIYWKKSLKNYINNYFNDYSLIVKELSFYKIDRTEQAVRTWIKNENIIGPPDKEVYKAISKITKDKYLLDHWEEVYESCNTIRTLRTRLKDNFKSMVLKSVINKKSDGEFERLVYDVLGDLKIYAEIEEIENIENVLINVPVNNTNCILTKSNI